jgi:hypothetical protein
LHPSPPADPPQLHDHRKGRALLPVIMHFWCAPPSWCAPPPTQFR